VGVNFISAVGDDFTGVEKALGVKDAFDVAHQADELVAELSGHELGASHAHSMLAGQRAVEPPHQRRDVLGDLTEFAQVLRTAQIEHRANVQQTGGGVAVKTGPQPAMFQNRLQSGDVIGQLLGAHSRVFDDGHRLRRRLLPLQFLSHQSFFSENNRPACHCVCFHFFGINPFGCRSLTKIAIKKWDNILIFPIYINSYLIQYRMQIKS